MAASLSSAAAKLGIHDRAFQYSPAVSSVSIPQPRCAQLVSCPKEILGTALLPQNAPVYEPSSRQQKKIRRFTIEAAKRVSNKRSFILSTTLKAQEEEVEKVSTLCDGIRQWAAEKRKDAATGCKQFECYADLYDKNVFHFMEEYASVLHMNDFRASPEHTKFFEEVRPLLLEPIALAVYEFRDGQVGDMLNPIGPKGEGGLDDATGQAGRGGEAYMKPKAKKRRGIEYESKTKGFARKAGKGAEEDKWSFENIIATVLGQGSKSTSSDSKSNEEQWSLKSLFGKKK